MLQSSPKRWNYDLKRRRELNFYKDSPVKTIALVPVSVKVLSSLSLSYNNNNNRLDVVISPSALKKFTTINLPYLSRSFIFRVLVSALTINDYLCGLFSVDIS